MMSSLACVDIGSDKLQEVAELEKNINIDERYGLSWAEEDERWKSTWVVKVEEARLVVDTSLNGSSTVEAVLLLERTKTKQGRVFNVTLHSRNVTRDDMSWTRDLAKQSIERSDGSSGESSSSSSGEDESIYNLEDDSSGSELERSLNDEAVEPEMGSVSDTSLDSVESVAWEVVNIMLLRAMNPR